MSPAAMNWPEVSDEAFETAVARIERIKLEGGSIVEQAHAGRLRGRLRAIEHELDQRWRAVRAALELRPSVTVEELVEILAREPCRLAREQAKALLAGFCEEGLLVAHESAGGLPARHADCWRFLRSRDGRVFDRLSLPATVLGEDGTP